MEYFLLFYLGGFAIVMLVLAYIGLRQDGIDARRVIRTFLKKAFQAVGVTILGILLAVVLGWIVGKGSIADSEGLRMLQDSWWTIGLVVVPSVVIIWHSVVKEERRKLDEEKHEKRKHLIKLRS